MYGANYYTSERLSLWREFHLYFINLYAMVNEHRLKVLCTLNGFDQDLLIFSVPFLVHTSGIFLCFDPLYHSLKHKLPMTRVDYFIANTIINRSRGKGIDVKPRMGFQWSQCSFYFKVKQGWLCGCGKGRILLQGNTPLTCMNKCNPTRCGSCNWLTWETWPISLRHYTVILSSGNNFQWTSTFFQPISYFYMDAIMPYSN